MGCLSETGDSVALEADLDVHFLKINTKLLNELKKGLLDTIC